MQKYELGLDVWVVSEDLRFLIRRGFIQSVITETSESGYSARYRVKLTSGIITTTDESNVFPVSGGGGAHAALCRIESITSNLP